MKSFYFTSEKRGNSKGLIFTTESGQPKGSKIVPVIPNASQYIRDMNKYGLVGMGIRRVARLGPLKLIKIGLFGLARAHKVLKKDFKRLLEMLLYVELQDFKKHRPKFVFLTPTNNRPSHCE